VIVTVKLVTNCIGVYVFYFLVQKKTICDNGNWISKNLVYFLVKVLNPTVTCSIASHIQPYKKDAVLFGMSTKSNWKSSFRFRFIKIIFSQQEKTVY
jgi:hypothetical protein